MNYTTIRETNFEKARKKLRENKGKRVVFIGDDDINRKILEKEKVDVLLIKEKARRDKAKQRDSGFDSVMARLAKKNNVKIGIDFDEILQSGNLEKARILGRIRQNIRLCNKNKIKMKFIPEKRNRHDLRALGLILGMPTWMTKDI